MKPLLCITSVNAQSRRRGGGQQLGYSWCGGLARWGTDRKESTIKKYYKTINDNIVEYVGIAADEEKRIPRAREKGQILPLVDFNMTESDALKYCFDNGYDWIEDDVELYTILDRVSCWCCKNKNLNELRQMYKYLPKYWKKLKEMQDKTFLPYKNYKYKGKPCRTVQELENRFKEEENSSL